MNIHRHSLAEIIRRPVITSDSTSGILIDNVCTLKHLVLQRGIEQSQPLRSVDRRQIDVLEVDAGTRVRRGTVQRRGDVVAGRAREVLPGDVGDLHAGGVARRGGVLAVDALGDLDGEADVCEAEVAERYVAHEAAATAAGVAVGGRALLHALPRLDVRAVGGVDQRHVLEHDVLVVVGTQEILPHGADRHAVPAMAGHVADVQIRRVALGRDAIVAILHRPILQQNVPRVPRVSAVCVDSAISVGARRIHIDIAHRHVLAVSDERGPELRLDDIQVFHQEICRVVECHCDGPPGLVGVVPVLRVPGLAVPVQRPSCPVDRHVHPSK